MNRCRSSLFCGVGILRMSSILLGSGLIPSLPPPEEDDLAGLDGAFLGIEYETFLFGNLH